MLISYSLIYYGSAATGSLSKQSSTNCNTFHAVLVIQSLIH
jgi:hypothetical protein